MARALTSRPRLPILLSLAGALVGLAPAWAGVPSIPAPSRAGPAPDRARPAPDSAGPALDRDGGRRLVAVVRAPDADGTCQEIATRIIAELTADRVPVVSLTCLGADPMCLTASGTRVAAVVVVQTRDNVRGVEVRTGQPAAGAGGLALAGGSAASRVQRVDDFDSGGAPAALAVRTVELLKAMLLEVAEPPSPITTVSQQADEDRPPQDRPAAAVETNSRIVPKGPHNVTMSIGAAVISSFAGLSSAYGPALSVGRRTSDHVLLSAYLLVPAFAADQRNAAGTVAVRHAMAALQAELVGLFLGQLVLRAGIGAGAYHLHIDGQPTLGFPMLPRSDDSYSWMLSWSAGLVANVRPDFGLFVDGRMFVLTPTPVVLLNGLEVGRAGNPGISITAGVEVRL